MRIKFNRVKLIAALKESRQQALEQFKRDTREYHLAQEKALKKHIENVKAYLKRLQTEGEEVIRKYDLRDLLDEGVRWPTKPKKPDMATVDNTIQILELTDAEAVECNTKEQYVELTRACAILGTCKI